MRVDQPFAEPVAQLAVTDEPYRAVEQLCDRVEREDVGDNGLCDLVDLAFLKKAVGLEDQ